MAFVNAEWPVVNEFTFEVIVDLFDYQRVHVPEASIIIYVDRMTGDRIGFVAADVHHIHPDLMVHEIKPALPAAPSA